VNGKKLRFLADESCDFGVVRALRSEGHDVFAVAEMMSRSDDRELIDFAATEERILVTEDKDFGRLVHVAGASSNGVIFIRYPGNRRGVMTTVVCSVVREYGDRLNKSFVVIEPGYVRISQLP
jgi:predicted nuclease of predicted toxin-antitoxin system